MMMMVIRIELDYVHDKLIDYYVYCVTLYRFSIGIFTRGHVIL